MKRLLSLTVLTILIVTFGSRGEVPAYEKVRELDPAGYWPLDEGGGDILHDRSGNDNHGQAHFLSWRNGLLDFKNIYYQWVQIPYDSAYKSQAFSMGGWVFNRKEYDNLNAPPDLARKYGAVIMGQPLRYVRGELRWALITGKGGPSQGAVLRFGPPPSGSGSTLEVASGGENDCIGSVDSEIALPTDEWQHIFYTYDGSGTGKLYRNGRLVHSSKNISYKIKESPYVIGSGCWGTRNVGGTISLDGSVRDMTLFDRVLKPEEVEQLYAITGKPDAVPSEPGDEVKEPDAESPPKKKLIERVRNENLEEKVRAEAALSLAEMGEDASDAVPALSEVLMQEKNGAHLPKIEEFLRNAVMRALLDIARQDEQVRDLLGEKLAKPFLDSLDLSKPYLDQVRPLAEQGRYMDALDALRNHLRNVPKLPDMRGGWGSKTDNADKISSLLPLREVYTDAYFSRGNPFNEAHYSAFNRFDIVNDKILVTTQIERVSFEEVKRQYEKTLASFTDEKPDPEGKWTRVKIIKIDGEGNKETSYLGGPWFIFDARDKKLDGWAPAVDKDGYIHLLGGSHNRPEKKKYIPGSWEKFGISSRGDDKAAVMYWVSEDPRNIESFEFEGQQNNPRYPGTGMNNYIQFSQSPDGTLFTYGRGDMWSWSLRRYDESEQRWTKIEGDSSAMMNRAARENPEWYESLGDIVPVWGPAEAAFVEAWQPGMYNFCRLWRGAIRGITFDKTGRMHVQLQILGVGKEGRMTQRINIHSNPSPVDCGLVYAYSDDLGETFHRADGTRLELPLTVNPIPSHNAHMIRHSTKERFDVWLSLIQEAGWKTGGGFDRQD